jgi:hypothetical protein
MLSDELLPFIPEERINDVIYFNPADVECPVVLNPLHIESGDDIDLHVDEAFTILQRVAGEGGPRMDEILRHSLYALIERKDSTLLDLERLLDRNDDSFRKQVLQETGDDQTRRFFQQVYPQLPKDAHLPILNRIGRIVRSKYVRNCLCPPTRTSLSDKEASKRLLNIRQAMDDGKILLFNLSDGLLGEAASQLIGQFIVSKFQTATMSRANESKIERMPFYLYLDEFQNFCGIASKSYEKLLSRARKYRLGLILAHQQTGQLPLELMREISATSPQWLVSKCLNRTPVSYRRNLSANVILISKRCPLKNYYASMSAMLTAKSQRIRFPCMCHIWIMNLIVSAPNSSFSTRVRLTEFPGLR